MDGNFYINVFLPFHVCECRILQYGRMSVLSEGGNEWQTTSYKAEVEARGDQGLLNLSTNNTVFYVGGYPSTFKVSAPRAACCCCG